MTTESKKAAPYKLPLHVDRSEVSGWLVIDGAVGVARTGAQEAAAALVHAANTLPAALALIAELREALFRARGQLSSNYVMDAFNIIATAQRNAEQFIEKQGATDAQA